MPAAIIALKLAGRMPDMHADYIGVDKGTLALIRQNLPVKLAIGDFDSVTTEEMQLIEECAGQIIQLNPVKDDTDSEAALNEALKRGYDQILMMGAVGGRMDHAMINLRLALQHPEQVILLDDQNRIEAYSAGVHAIKKENYSYISFFTDDEAQISLAGFRYSLKDRVITKDDLYTVSNEMTGDIGTLTVKKGTVLVIQSKDER